MRKKLAKSTERWTPATVSWLSFFIMGLVVAGVGLAGTGHVISYLHERLSVHGIEHNREIAERLEPLLAAGLGDGNENTVKAIQNAVCQPGYQRQTVLLPGKQNRRYKPGGKSHKRDNRWMHCRQTPGNGQQQCIF